MGYLRPSLKRDKFCAKSYFPNVNVLSGNVSLLTNETLAVMLTRFLTAYQHVFFMCSQSFQVFCESVRVLHDCPNNASAHFAMETKKIKVNKFGIITVQESLEIKILNAP